MPFVLKLVMTAKLNDPRIPAHFWAKITISDQGCWKWGGSIMGIGYSRLYVEGERLLGHRYFYEMFKGQIPAGLHVDHACHNRDAECNLKGDCPHRSCVNPDHLDAVTPGENILRSTHTTSNKNAAKEFCVNGHPYDEGNTRVTKTGAGQKRECRKCGAEYAAKKAALDRETHIQKGRDYYAANKDRLREAARVRNADPARKAAKKAHDAARRGGSKLSRPVQD